jgi:hypothetical protein
MPIVTIQPKPAELKIANCKKINGVIESFFIDYCFVGAWFKSEVPTINESFIRFDIMKYIPQNVAVKKATMMLYPNSSSGMEIPNNSVDGIHTVAVYELTSHFADGGVVDTASYPSYDPAIIDQKEFPESTWFEFDVSSTVQKIVNGEHENFGFTLKPLPLSVPVGSNFFYKYNGKQGGTIPQELCAKIVIEYTDALITPNNLYPDNVKYKKDEEITFSWNFNGYEVSDRQKFFELQYKINTGDWVTVTQTTSNQYYTFAANTFTAGTVTWKVKTTDNNNTTSLYSNDASFTVVNPPVKPTITNDATVTTAKPTITWTSTNQKGYHIKIKDAENNVIWQDNNENSTAKSKAIDIILKNTKTYTIELKIIDSNGFWSEAATKNVIISVSSPVKPKMTLKAIDKKAGKTTFIINANDLSFYEIFRKAEKEDNYIKIATNKTETNYSDYTQASGRSYTYFVRAYNAVYGFTDSNLITAILSIDNSIISLVSDPQKYINLEVRNVKQSSKAIDVKYNKYTGRINNIPEFGEFEEESISLEFETFNKFEFETLQDLIDKKETLLYRDEQGKKLYGTIASLQIDEDKNMDYWVYSFDFKKSDFNEEVR